jgi:hypothetical protein
MLWIGRIAAALLGTWLYARLNAPNWHNRYHLLYDVPTLPVAFAYAGESLCRFCLGDVSGAGIRIAALLAALGCGCGAQYGSWPLSGHLTVAVTVGTLTVAEPNNPLLWRLFALLPVVLLVVIRCYRPQSVLMSSTFNTLTGLLLGALLGGLTLFLIRWRPSTG